MYKFSTLSSKPEHASSKLELDVSSKHLNNEYKHATWESSVPFFWWPRTGEARSKKMFRTSFLDWRDNFFLEKDPRVQTRSWQWPWQTWSQLGSIFNGAERAELFMRSVFVQPYKLWSVQTGKCKWAGNLFSSMFTSWLQLPVPGILKKNIPAQLQHTKGQK